VPWLENRSRNAVSSARVIETKMIFERKKKKEKKQKNKKALKEKEKN